MLGGVNPPTELGGIPCAISWLYKGINERRQKSGARFSVRVSALGVSATKPDSTSKDLLAAHATGKFNGAGGRRGKCVLTFLLMCKCFGLREIRLG